VPNGNDAGTSGVVATTQTVVGATDELTPQTMTGMPAAEEIATGAVVSKTGAEKSNSSISPVLLAVLLGVVVVMAAGTGVAVNRRRSHA